MSIFKLTLRSRLTCSAAACPTFSKSPTISQPQLSIKYLISDEQSLDFWIIIKWSRYCLIRLLSHRIYDILIVEQSYEDQIRNVGNPVWSLCDQMYCFGCQSIKTSNKTFILFYILFLHTSTIEPVFNLYTISSFIWYICCLGINLSSPSK